MTFKVPRQNWGKEVCHKNKILNKLVLPTLVVD